MTFEEYQRRSQLIDRRLKAVNDRVLQLVMHNQAIPANPEFAALMGIHQELTDATERLINAMQIDEAPREENAS